MNEVIIRRGTNGSLFAGDRNGHDVAAMVKYGGQGEYFWYVEGSNKNTVLENASQEAATIAFFDTVRDALSVD